MTEDKKKKTHKDSHYKLENRRVSNKIRHFRMHNIPKDADEVTAKKLLNEFIELQSNRKRGK